MANKLAIYFGNNLAMRDRVRDILHQRGYVVLSHTYRYNAWFVVDAGARRVSHKEVSSFEHLVEYCAAQGPSSGHKYYPVDYSKLEVNDV